jgi:hypothetical protein
MQTGKEKAADFVRTHAFSVIQTKLSYSFGEWRRATLNAIIEKHGKLDHTGRPRGIGNSTFSSAIKGLVARGLVIDCIDHYQLASTAPETVTTLPHRYRRRIGMTVPGSAFPAATCNLPVGSDEEFAGISDERAVALLRQQKAEINELKAEVSRLNAIITGGDSGGDALRYLQSIYSNKELPLSVTMKAAVGAIPFERSKPPSLNVSAYVGLAVRLAAARAECHAAEAAGRPTPVLDFSNRAEPDE